MTTTIDMTPSHTIDLVGAGKELFRTFEQSRDQMRTGNTNTEFDRQVGELFATPLEDAQHHVDPTVAKNYFSTVRDKLAGLMSKYNKVNP